MSTAKAKPPCTVCGGVVQVLDSRIYADGHMHRRSKCKSCGDSFRTVEIRRELYTEMLMQVEQFNMVKQLLRTMT